MPGEQRAETAEARITEVHADLGDRIVSAVHARSRQFHTMPDAISIRRFAENRFELTDEVKLRHSDFSGNRGNGIIVGAKHVSPAAQSNQVSVCQHLAIDRAFSNARNPKYSEAQQKTTLAHILATARVAAERESPTPWTTYYPTREDFQAFDPVKPPRSSSCGFPQ